ncbi:anti-sigma factor [Kangiella aquimarina]|uniref:Anti-sigma factor n=1 Tax=Kangiella aquimarina TaxID=261965 RepID=A0ABZ0X6M7_9GAMM|nr:anti-sigma factor [Kangiella aquimarina]WQG86170.1 anti-sigma factor [Kangiella aquimarina]
MRYHNEELSNELAKHYVIGTMSPLARRRFKKLMVKHSHLQQAVWHWEQILNPMAEELKPITPDSQVWQSITARLGWNSKGKVSSGSWWTISGWLATTACLLLVAYIWMAQPVTPPTQQPQALAVLQVEQNQPAWVVQKTGNTLTVSVSSLPDIQPDQDFELWMLPANGQAPISLGLLPESGNKTLSVPAQLKDLVQSGLAVSIEPENGSPTGAPTGPIILTAQWIQITG